MDRDVSQERIDAALTVRQAHLIRGALMAYRSMIEHVAAELGVSASGVLLTLVEAKMAIEQALEDVSDG